MWQDPKVSLDAANSTNAQTPKKEVQYILSALRVRNYQYRIIIATGSTTVL